jgi:hypothetical protein
MIAMVRADLFNVVSRATDAQFRPAINWTWAVFDGAQAEVNARFFERYIRENLDYETRGVYPPTNHDSTFAVRFR